jgi:hypothetical protein
MMTVVQSFESGINSSSGYKCARRDLSVECVLWLLACELEEVDVGLAGVSAL